MNTHDIELPPLPKLQVPVIDADIDLMDIRRLAVWCENVAKAYARAAVKSDRQRRGEPVKCDGNHGGSRCADPECWNDSSD